MLALVAAGYFYLHRAPKLTDKDTIVLADFTNTTGDPVFDGTLRQGLAVQLEQSPFLSLVSDERIQRDAAPDGPAGGCAAYSGARSGNLRANRAAPPSWKARLPASEASTYWGCAQRTAAPETSSMRSRRKLHRKEDVLNALSQIASKFRTRAGESLATVEKHELRSPRLPRRRSKP